MTVGQRIEAIAAEKNLPAGAALAALLGVRYETLRKWRTGEAAPNRTRQEVIAQVLGVAPHVFMHGVGNEAPVSTAQMPWPFERITPEQWAALTQRQQGAIEDAAMQKLRELADETPKFLRKDVTTLSRKRA